MASTTRTHEKPSEIPPSSLLGPPSITSSSELSYSNDEERSSLDGCFDGDHVLGDYHDITSTRDLQIQTTNERPTTTSVRREFQAKAQDFKILLREVTKMILDYYDACGRPTETQLHASYSMPEQILERLGGSLPLTSESESSNNNDTGNEACLKDLEVCFQYSLKTMHPFFFDKLYFGTDPIGQIAELVIAVLNGNTHVYHVSPVFSLMEVEIIQWMGQQFGFSKEHIEGTLNPGGSMSNLMALLLARNEHFPHVKKQGWARNDRPVAFTAVQSHYSVSTAAMVTGMGSDQMIQVPANHETSQMDPVALEECIQKELSKGNKPFFVNAVAGSTVMGAFDDLKAISKICKRYGLWFHVDACWGGFLIFAKNNPKGRSLLEGVEQADSISFNPHKGLGIPQQCSMLITNNKKDAFIRSNGTSAEYLYGRTGYDLGDKTLGCGRRADALKFWLSIRKHGIGKFQQIADNELEKAEHMTNLVRESPDFELVAEPMATTVCYWYTPKYFQLHPEEYTEELKAKVHKLIFHRMKLFGRCLIQQNPLAEFQLPNFFRLALGADRTRLEDMAFLLEETRRLGQEITPIDLDSSK